MAKCSVCGKGVTFGRNVSHSNRKTNRMWKPNIRRVKADCKWNAQNGICLFPLPSAPTRLRGCLMNFGKQNLLLRRLGLSAYWQKGDFILLSWSADSTDCIQESAKPS